MMKSLSVEEFSNGELRELVRVLAALGSVEIRINVDASADGELPAGQVNVIVNDRMPPHYFRWHLEDVSHFDIFRVYRDTVALLLATGLYELVEVTTNGPTF